ncbi:hypothetical protein NC652_032071 [Populus alba x Populus x berolinensis]|nr:hypothetical protein NC652_032071 [Populus alba x Populus x berolinensis]
MPHRTYVCRILSYRFFFSRLACIEFSPASDRRLVPPYYNHLDFSNCLLLPSFLPSPFPPFPLSALIPFFFPINQLFPCCYTGLYKKAKGKAEGKRKQCGADYGPPLRLGF